MKSDSKYNVYFGNAANLEELKNGEISLVVTSPPYYNAPFDYEGLFKDYDEYLELLKNMALIIDKDGGWKIQNNKKYTFN